MIKIKMETWGRDLIVKVVECRNETPGYIFQNNDKMTLKIYSEELYDSNSVLTQDSIYIGNKNGRGITMINRYPSTIYAENARYKFKKLFDDYNLHKKLLQKTDDIFTIPITPTKSATILFKKLNDYTIIMQVQHMDVFNSNVIYKGPDLTSVEFKRNNVHHVLDYFGIRLVLTTSDTYSRKVYSIIFNNAAETNDYYNRFVKYLIILGEQYNMHQNKNYNNPNSNIYYIE